MSVPLLHIDHLTRSYPGSDSVLFDDFSFTLHPGEFLFITGRSGAGKTTLTRFITGEITPPVDTVFFGRQDLARLSRSELQEYRKQIGIVFQDFKLLQRKTIRQNILFPLQIDESKYEVLESELHRVAEQLHIHHTLDSYPQDLSGGEKQRAAIARALIRQPQFLIMDEPTGNIDTESSLLLLQDCLELNAKGVTIIFVTHDRTLIDHAENLGYSPRHLHV